MADLSGCCPFLTSQNIKAVTPAAAARDTPTITSNNINTHIAIYFFLYLIYETGFI
jgi:hypothetical protein